MREQLVKEIKKRFGFTFGAKRRKEMREEIILNALDRYDEEVGNGASPEDAYATALRSVGDLQELKVNGRTIRIVFFIAICVFAAASLVNMAILSWLIFAFTLIGYALLLSVLWHLLFDPFRKTHYIVKLIIGILIVVNILIPVLSVFLFSVQSEPAPWTYIDDPAAVEYVEFIKISVQYSPYKEEYEVITMVPKNAIQELITDLKKVNYKGYGPPRGINDGDRGFLITFKEGYDVPVSKVFYGMYTIGSIDKDVENGSAYIHSWGVKCSNEDWEKMLDTYVRPFL